MSYSEFAGLARDGYPMNDLLRMAGADYEVEVKCDDCDNRTMGYTGAQEDEPVLCDTCLAYVINAEKDLDIDRNTDTGEWIDHTNDADDDDLPF